MNKHVKEYLNYYKSLELTPHYAVMLRGNWGSGKTWFIKEFIQKNNQDEFLYVSLYGISSYNEIEDIFFQQLHPILASKGMKLAGKILKGIVKATIKVDLDGNGKEDLNINSGIPDVNLPDYMQNIDSKIIVFDDLERCSISTQNILGYINQFVETNGLKVIILANEEEIIKLDELANNTDNVKTYLTIKEKLIGKSFDIQTDFDSAINTFIAETKNEKGKKILRQKRILIKELFDVANYKNLRHLRQAILDFGRFYEFIPSSAKKKSDLIEHIISLFFAISFEIKKGKITEDEIAQLFFIDYYSKNKEKTPIQEIRSKYSVFQHYYHPIQEYLWVEYFKKGILDKKDLKKSIDNSNYFQQENTPNWVKLWYYLDLDDDDFDFFFQSVYNDFENFKIEDKYVLVQVTCMLINFSEIALIPYEKNDIIELAKKNIEQLKTVGSLTLVRYEEFPADSSHNLMYQGLKIPETIDFLKYIAEQVSSTQFENHQLFADELLFDLSESIEFFGQRITLSNNQNSLYYDIPILNFIPPKKFVETILKLSNKNKQYLSRILQKRYLYNDVNIKIKDELDWLKNTYKLLKKEREKLNNKNSGYIIEFSLLKSIQNCIRQLELSN